MEDSRITRFRSGYAAWKFSISKILTLGQHTFNDQKIALVTEQGISLSVVQVALKLAWQTAVTPYFSVAETIQCHTHGATQSLLYRENIVLSYYQFDKHVYYCNPIMMEISQHQE